MPNGALAHLGLGKEATWGTAVAASDYLKFVSEGITKEIEQVIAESMSGIVDEAPSFEGMHTITGDISTDVYPNSLGHLLRSAFGAPTTTQPDAVNNPTVYQHVFTPAQSEFSNVCALPPYTVEVHRDLAQAFQYAGTVINDLTLNFGTDNKIMRASASVIAKKLALIAKTTPSFENTAPFLWDQAAISIGGTANTDVSTLEFGVNNSLEGRATLDGSKDVSRIKRSGKRTFPVSFTMDLTSLTEFNRFNSQGEVAASITLTGAAITGTYAFKMTVDIPKLRYTAFPINVGGAGEVTAQVTGSAKYDNTSAYAAKVTLVNTKSAY